MNLEIAGIIYSVLAIQGTEKLNAPFNFLLTIEVEQDFVVTDNLLQSATLIFTGQATKKIRYCNGVVTAIENIELTTNRLQRIKLRLQSRLALMKQQNSSKIIANKNIPELIDTLLMPYGIFKQHYLFQLFNCYPDKFYRVQAPDQTDLEFLQRILAEQGICFSWINCYESEKIIFTDNITKYHYKDLLEVRADSSGNCLAKHPVIESVTKHYRLKPDYFIIRDYSESIPETILEAYAGKPSYYFQHYFAHNLPSYEQIKKEALLALERSKVASLWLVAVSQIHYLYPGQLVQLITQDSEIAGRYLIVNIKHHFKKNNYSNWIKLIPLANNYRPIVNNSSRMPSAWLGIIKGKQLYPTLDKTGSYMLQQGFRLSGDPIASLPSVRFLSHNSAWHLPLPKAAQVVISYINEDPQRPIILGACHNKDKMDPVSSANPKQSCLISAAKNSLLFNNVGNQSGIKVQMGDCNAYLNLPNARQNKTTLASLNGDINLSAKEDILLQSPAENWEYCGKSRLHQVKQNYRIRSISADIALRANNINLQGNAKIVIRARSDLELSTIQGIRLDIKKKMLSIAQEIVISAEDRVKLQSNSTIIVKSNSTFQLGNRWAGIQITASGMVKCFGKFIHLLANKSYLGQIVFNQLPYHYPQCKVPNLRTPKLLQVLNKNQQQIEVYQDELHCVLQYSEVYYSKLRDGAECIFHTAQSNTATTIQQNTLLLKMVNLKQAMIMRYL